MYCQNRISYRVQEGDSLYKLSKQFKTTVTELILLNSGVNPYNLQVGMRLTICPGEGYEEDDMEAPPSGRPDDNPNEGWGNVITVPGNRPGVMLPDMNTGNSSLRQRMRMAWLNHIMLVKFYLISFFENLPSQNAWKSAVSDNANEIVNIYAQYYPPSAMQRFRSLFMQHLQLTDQVAADLKADPTATNETMQNWYRNAEEMAAFLSRQTPAYNETELRKMLYDHLDMERQQMEAYLDGEYGTDIDIFLKSQRAMMNLADFLASGLLMR